MGFGVKRSVTDGDTGTMIPLCYFGVAVERPHGCCVNDGVTKGSKIRYSALCYYVCMIIMFACTWIRKT